MLQHRRTQMMRVLVVLVFSGCATVPLAAQDYSLGYTAPGYDYGQNKVLDQFIDGLIGSLNVNDRQPIRQCVYAALTRAEDKYRGRLGHKSCRPEDAIRVKSITYVERRLDGTRVRGQLDAGLIRGYAEGDVDFRCDVDSRGYVGDVKVSRNYRFAGSVPWP